jgi:mannose-6-phosphate isomerase-like protein (cupin superfamily)
VDFGNHLLEITHREKDGRAELHKTKADVMVIQSGTATIVWGGEVIDPAPTALNEIQGSGIKGGQKQEVGPGDVIEIPAGIPHQFILAPGTQITYLVVKVVKP